MFCPKCGTELPNDSAFCYKCGNKIELNVKETINNENVNKPKERIKKEEDNQEFLTVSPTYNFLARFLKQGGIIVLIILLFTLAAGFGAFFLTTIIVGIPIGIAAGFKFEEYKSIVCVFSNTKAIYNKVYLGNYNKEISYENVKEITWNQTYIQKLFDLGTINIYTNAESGPSNGICLYDIKDPFTVCEQITKIINK